MFSEILFALFLWIGLVGLCSAHMVQKKFDPLLYWVSVLWAAIAGWWTGIVIFLGNLPG